MRFAPGFKTELDDDDVRLHAPISRTRQGRSATCPARAPQLRPGRLADRFGVSPSFPYGEKTRVNSPSAWSARAAAAMAMTDSNLFWSRLTIGAKGCAPKPCCPNSRSEDGMRYECPTTTKAAVQLLARAAGRAYVLAGGTDLLVRMRTGFIEPSLVVDIKRIAAMRAIRKTAAGLRDRRGGVRRRARRACGGAQGLAGRGRSGQSDRLQADPGPRHDGRQSLQCLAGRRQRAGHGRRGREGGHLRTEKAAHVRGRAAAQGTGPDFPRQGRDHRVDPAAEAPCHARATPICGSFRAPRWTSRSSARPSA